MQMGEREAAGQRSPRRSRRRRKLSNEAKSPSPAVSPGSWNVERGRSRVRRPSNAFSEESLRMRGYHSLHSSFGKVFHVEKRWKLVREMGSGAYGVVISAADEISGETVAIKLVTRVFDKIPLAKRALREITLLRHFSHENITGLIDVDAISHDFNEIYIFMEPMEADLHQIIKSGQVLTNEHVQYFLYQILRGMKYIHSASVIHRDLKPGNLLVNADCELKICDFGLSRGFESGPDENVTHLTEYVATRWYRAPEIMLAFSAYNTAIDVWSIGCILAELLQSKPLFKGEDYVDQLNKVLDVLGTPDESVIRRIGSEKAQAYVRLLPYKSTVPFRKLLPTADPQALDLLTSMLTFDPSTRITVLDALEHPWLAAYHDVNDEPSCPHRFEKWRAIEQLETLDDFREALWDEIQDFRREVRGMNIVSSSDSPLTSPETDDRLRLASVERDMEPRVRTQSQLIPDTILEVTDESETGGKPTIPLSVEGVWPHNTVASPLDGNLAAPCATRDTNFSPADPVLSYARRSSILQPSRAGSTYASPQPSFQAFPGFSADASLIGEHGTLHASGGAGGGTGGIAFPSNGHGSGYIIPARSRTGSMAGEVTRKLLRTLSTVSIHESVEGLPIGKYIVEPTEADAPPSEMPKDFRKEGVGDSEGQRDGDSEAHEATEILKDASNRKGKFHLVSA